MFTPWNLYPARNVNTNGHIEVGCFNLLKPDGTIPLGPFAISPGLHALCPRRHLSSQLSTTISDMTPMITEIST